MRMIQCERCRKDAERTGRRQKYCKPCAKIVATEASYAHAVASGRIAKPGVGTGGHQHRGAENVAFKPDASHRYRDLRKDACERCGSTRFLCAHHKDEDRSNNDPSNIMTLCKSCHQKEHKCHLNYMVGYTDKRRKKTSQNMVHQNKTLPRINGHNAKEQ